MYPAVETSLMDRSIDIAHRLLAHRTSGMDIRHYPRHPAWLETPLDGRLASGCAADGLCLVAAAVAAAAGDDRTELLPHSVALSPIQRLR